MNYWSYARTTTENNNRLLGFAAAMHLRRRAIIILTAKRFGEYLLGTWEKVDVD